MSRWLGRARRQACPGFYTEQLLWEQLNGQAQVPVAALGYRNDFGDWPAQPCLRADPVHLRADTNGLLLFDSAAFDLDLEESRALAATVATHLAQDGLTLKVGAAERWYILADRVQDLRSAPLPLARGKPVSVSDLQGADAAAWRKRLNEVQMLIYDHPVNQSRAAVNKTVINSLWVWGEGDVPLPGVPAVNTVLTANTCARAWAEAGHLPAADLHGADDIAALLKPGVRMLVTLEQCRDTAAYEHFREFFDALENLEQTWFRPLLRMLAQRRIDRLELLPVNGQCYRLTRGGLWSFWKRSVDYRHAAGFFKAEATRV